MIDREKFKLFLIERAIAKEEEEYGLPLEPAMIILIHRYFDGLFREYDEHLNETVSGESSRSA